MNGNIKRNVLRGQVNSELGRGGGGKKEVEKKEEKGKTTRSSRSWFDLKTESKEKDL